MLNIAFTVSVSVFTVLVNLCENGLGNKDPQSFPSMQTSIVKILVDSSSIYYKHSPYTGSHPASVSRATSYLSWSGIARC